MPIAIGLSVGIPFIQSSDAGFSPLDLDGALIEWWDFRTSMYLTLGGGNAISNVAGRKPVYALVQATGSLQAIWDAAGFAKFDVVDDYFTLTLATGVAQGQIYYCTPYGWYKSGIGNWSAGVHRIAGADATQIVFVDAAVITANQRTALETYLGATSAYLITKTTDTTIYNRIDNTTNIDYTLSYKGANAVTYSLASSQAGVTVDVGAQGLTAPVHVVVPTDVGTDATLQILSCYNNAFSGISPSLTGLSALQKLYLYSNIFIGTFQALTGLSALQQLYLFSNKFSGTFPALTGLSALQTLHCDDNLFSGTFPALTGLSALQTLQCKSNAFSGTFPALTGLSALQTLRCGGNLFSGTFPALTGLSALQTLVCNFNNFSGTFPALTGLSALQTLDCIYNNFSGTFPSLTGLNALQTLYCEGNRFSDYTPSTVSATLKTVTMSSNLLPATAINAILADFVAAGAVSGTLILGGTGNAAPTGQGIVDKATLVGLGWTVLTN